MEKVDVWKRVGEDKVVEGTFAGWNGLKWERPFTNDAGGGTRVTYSELYIATPEGEETVHNVTVFANSADGDKTALAEFKDRAAAKQPIKIRISTDQLFYELEDGTVFKADQAPRVNANYMRYLERTDDAATL